MSLNDTKILMDFLSMPLGRTDEVFERFGTIHGAIRRGSGTEQFIFINGTRDDRVLLVAHADTFWDENYTKKPCPPQELFEQEGIVKNRRGGLGADDRAGCAMLWLLRETGHSLLVTDGEEHGQGGSSRLMSENPDIADEINLNHRFVVQFDRRKGTDFKCYSVGTDEFREYIGRTTGYSEPDRSAYTDIVTLCRDICGVNLSIGYHREHRSSEYLVLSEWLNTLDVCRRWLSEKDLPKFVLGGKE